MYDAEWDVIAVTLHYFSNTTMNYAHTHPLNTLRNKLLKQFCGKSLVDFHILSSLMKRTEDDEKKLLLLFVKLGR